MAGARSAVKPDKREVPAEVIARCQQGDISALEEIFEVCGGMVFSVCRRMCGRAEDAEDVTQEIFLRIFEKVGSFAGGARFSTWVYRVSVNHLLNHLKSEKRRRTDSIQDADDGLRAQGVSPLRAAERQEAGEHLDSLLAQLGPEQRAVVVLRELGGFTYAEISKNLEIPLGTVMSRLSRARKSLIGLIAETGRNAPVAE